MNQLKRNTTCTLGELRTGDRFTFGKKRVDVWQVMSKTNTFVCVNQPGWNGDPIHKHDGWKGNKTEVVFLRHTIPEPGEQCLIRDLKPGNVFHLLTDVISEYVLIEIKDFQFIHIGVVTGNEPPGPLDPSDLIVFIRTK